MSKPTFSDWVSLTCPEWMPVNSEYLRVRNIGVTQRNCTLFVTPLTLIRSVVFVVAECNVMQTLMIYDELPNQRPSVRCDRKTDVRARAASRIVAEGRVPAADILGRAKVSARGAHGEEALRAYSEGDIDFDGLQIVLSAEPNRRLAAMCHALGRRKESA